MLSPDALGSEGTSARSDSPVPTAQSTPKVEVEERPPDPELEQRLLGYLSELLSLPSDSLTITDDLSTVSIDSGQQRPERQNFYLGGPF